MATVCLYLASRDQLVRLERVVQFERVPATGEWFRFEKSGLLARQVQEVTHSEGGSVTVVLPVAKNADGTWDLYGSQAELDQEVADLVDSGWALASSVPNLTFRNDA